MTNFPYRFRALVLLVAVGALLAAACGSDSEVSTEDTSTPTADPTEEATPPPTEDQATEDPAAAATATEEATPEATAEPTLTASYRGVTEDSIKIGVVLFDLDAILDLGVDVGYGDQTQHIQIAIDELNASGGILGRMIEPVYRTISPVDTTQSDAVCIELTEDEEVFLTIGVLRPSENVFCYTQFADTPFIGALNSLTDAVFDESLVPMIFPGTRPSRSDEALLLTMEQDGVIEGGIIGVHGSDTDRLDRLEAGLLERGAAEVVKSVETASEADQLALAAELDVVVQRYQADGVTTAINTEDNVAYLAAFNRNGYGVPLYTFSPDVQLEIIYDQGATDAELMLVTRVGVASAADLYRDGHGPTVDCIDRWNEARPDELAVPNAPEGELQNFGVIIVACEYIDILTRAATAAGPDLTVESFTAALDDVGAFEMAGSRFSSLASTKWDANDTAAIFRWNDEAGEITWAADLDIG
jgi:hypothetical protein